MNRNVKDSWLRPVSLKELARSRGLHTDAGQHRIVGSAGYITRTPTSVMLHLDGQEPQPLQDLGPSLDRALHLVGIVTPPSEAEQERRRERADARALRRVQDRPASFTNLARMLIQTLPIRASGPFERWPRNEP